MWITGSSSIRRLKDCPVVMDLHELSPVDRRAKGRQDWRRLERFAEVCQDLPDRPRIGDECDQPDVAAAVRALKWKLLPHPRHQFRPRNPRRVVRAGLLIRIRTTAAPRGATAGRMPTGHSLAPLADVPDGQRRNGGPELVIRRKDAFIPMPVLTRRRHEIGQPVQEVTRRELDDAVRPRPRGRSQAARTDPVGGRVSGEHVADFGCAAACVTCHRESLERKGWPGAAGRLHRRHEDGRPPDHARRPVSLRDKPWP
jgi:hypothetical protein